LKRQGIKQICGSLNHLGDLWDGTYPAMAYTILRRTGEEHQIWLESENEYTIFKGNTELARTKTKKGLGNACKLLTKKTYQ